MKKESYLLQPQAVEIHAVKNGVDIILRKNIEEVETEDIESETPYKCWECDEVQYRYKGMVTNEEVESKFEYWWSIAKGVDEVTAIDKQAESDKNPTVIERLDALESGLAELAEVMCNG